MIRLLMVWIVYVMGHNARKLSLKGFENRLRYGEKRFGVCVSILNCEYVLC